MQINLVFLAFAVLVEVVLSVLYNPIFFRTNFSILAQMGPPQDPGRTKGLLQALPKVVEVKEDVEVVEAEEAHDLWALADSDMLLGSAASNMFLDVLDMMEARKNLRPPYVSVETSPGDRFCKNCAPSRGGGARNSLSSGWPPVRSRFLRSAGAWCFWQRRFRLSQKPAALAR